MTKVTVFTFVFLPFFVAAQFTKVADEICEAETKAFVIIGENELNKTILKQPELRRFKVYQFDYESEFGKRLRVSQPTMYLFDKNMMVLAQEEITRTGWRRIKDNFAKKTSKDCLLLVESVEKATDDDLVERPSEEELGAFKIELPDPVKREPDTNTDTDVNFRWDDSDKKIKAPAPQTAKSTTAPNAKKEATPLNEDAAHGIDYQRFYTVQIGAYTNEVNAQKKVQQNSGLSPTYKRENVEGRDYYVVNFGTFLNRDAAVKVAQKHGGFVKEIK